MFLHAQIPWATAEASKSREDAQQRHAAQLSLSAGEFEDSLEETVEEKLLAAILSANEDLAGAFRIYDELQRLEEEQEMERAVQERSRHETRIDRTVSRLQCLCLVSHIHNRHFDIWKMKDLYSRTMAGRFQGLPGLHLLSLHPPFQTQPRPCRNRHIHISLLNTLHLPTHSLKLLSRHHHTLCNINYLMLVLHWLRLHQHHMVPENLFPLLHHVLQVQIQGV